MLFTPFFILVLPLISGKSIPPVEAIYPGLLIEVCGFGSATLGYHRQKVIDYRASGYAMLWAVPFAVGVSLFAYKAPEGWLLFILGQKMPARVSVASGVPVVMATVTAAVLARIVVTGTGMADFSVPWNIAAMCIPAVLIGGQIAPLINRYLNPNRIKLILFVLFCVVGLILIFRGLS